MKHFKINSILIALMILATQNSLAQVLDYTSVNYPTNLCNVFNTQPLKVVGGLTHYPVSGGVSYNNNALVLQTRQGSSPSTTFGTAYAIAATIKQGYKYNITVSAYKQSADPVSAPNFEIGAINSLPNPNTSNPTACGYVNQNSWTSLQFSQIGAAFINTTTETDYPIVQNYIATANSSYFTILAHSGSQTQNSNVFIKSIIITEIPPTPTFTITPQTVSIPCGSTTPVVFTVNNISNSSGTFSYSWNLGSTPNGWLYGGNPAPQTIVTSINNISLTPASITKPNNLSVTVSLNGPVVQTLTSIVTTPATPYLPPANYHITGPTDICGATNYTLFGASPTSSVNWQLLPANVASVTGNSNQATVTPLLNNVSATLRATLLNSSGCQAGYTDFLVRTIDNIKLTPQNMVVCYDDYYNIEYPRPIDVTFCPSNGIVTWDVPSEFNNDYTIVGNRLTLNSGPTYYIPSNNPLWITASVYNPSTGLTSTTHTNFWTQSCYGNFTEIEKNKKKIILSPNPSTGQFTVSLSSKDNLATIKQLRVKNKMGVVVYLSKTLVNQKQLSINLSNEQSDIYIIEVFDGKEWVSTKLSLQR